MLPIDLNTELLKRVGAHDGDLLLPQAASTPAELHAYLSDAHHRLVALRELYRSRPSDALAHTQWSLDYVEREVSLEHFRGDSAYMWQARDHNLPIHYMCTYYFYKCSSHRDLLRTCAEDDLFGVSSLAIDGECVTRDRLDSVSEISFLLEQLGLPAMEHLSVLDIGSGYGRFAHRLIQCFPNSYVICSDAIPESLFLCEFYLRYRGVAHAAKVVDVTAINAEIQKAPIDVAVAINSLSECSTASIRWWVALLRQHRIPLLFLVPHSFFDQGRTILSCERNRPLRIDVVKCLHEYGYVRRALVPKYREPYLQRYGISPTHYHLFSLQ